VQSAPGGASLSALKEGKSKNEQMATAKSDMTPCRRVRTGQLATVKQHPAAGDHFRRHALRWMDDLETPCRLLDRNYVGIDRLKTT
jgi:hypothetical protein